MNRTPAFHSVIHPSPLFQLSLLHLLYPETGSEAQAQELQRMNDPVPSPIPSH